MNDLLEYFDKGILTLTINRPERRNAITVELIEYMKQAITKAGENPSVRCIVITATGNAFCVGADAGEIPTEVTAAPPRKERVSDLRACSELSRLLYTVKKPTIAVMPGAAAGGGLGIALACDMRFCLDTATLSTAFSMIGGSGDFGVSYFLPRLVGIAKARELLFFSNRLTGQQAYEMGLVTRAVPKETFKEEAEAFVREIAALPTVALGYIKQNLNGSEYMPIEELLDLETENMVHCLETEDHINAVKAFVNKSKPVFNGR